MGSFLFGLHDKKNKTEGREEREKEMEDTGDDSVDPEDPHKWSCVMGTVGTGTDR